MFGFVEFHALAQRRFGHVLYAYVDGGHQVFSVLGLHGIGIIHRPPHAVRHLLFQSPAVNAAKFLLIGGFQAHARAAFRIIVAYRTIGQQAVRMHPLFFFLHHETALELPFFKDGKGADTAQFGIGDIPAQKKIPFLPTPSIHNPLPVGITALLRIHAAQAVAKRTQVCVKRIVADHRGIQIHAQREIRHRHRQQRMVGRIDVAPHGRRLFVAQTLTVRLGEQIRTLHKNHLAHTDNYRHGKNQQQGIHDIYLPPKARFLFRRSRICLAFAHCAVLLFFIRRFFRSLYLVGWNHRFLYARALQFAGHRRLAAEPHQFGLARYLPELKFLEFSFDERAFAHHRFRQIVVRYQQHRPKEGIEHQPTVPLQAFVQEHRTVQSRTDFLTAQTPLFLALQFRFVGLPLFFFFLFRFFALELQHQFGLRQRVLYNRLRFYPVLCHRRLLLFLRHPQSGAA